MAPIKRQREHIDDDDEIIAISNASSNLRQEHLKKVRLSGPTDIVTKRGRHHRDHSSISDAEDTSTHGVPQEAPPFSTQYEIERDAGFTHLDNPDLDDERATQRLLARSQLIGENHASENAIIESVTMINFMCHERLHVTLGPLINFIIGHNGSGKSAILTAITLCLGGKASTTNRGGSLKSFIKEGRDQASLIIKLKNQGLDAYQPDTYGETIIVERNFTKTGTSGFKLKNSAGRIVSTKKADVEDVIEYFQMQIDNPMTVLTQDNARQFLNTAPPAQKYKFFVKGVQLEQLDNDYRLVSETADAMTIKLDVNKARVKLLEENAKAAKEKVDLVNKHAGMREAVKKYSRQSAWAQVEEQERILEEREVVIREVQQKIDELEKDVRNKDQTYQQANEAAERAIEAHRILLDDFTPLGDEETQAKTAHDSAKQDLQNLHAEQRQIREHLNSAKIKAERIQDDIDLEQRKLEAANGGAHSRRLADLYAAQEKVVEAKAKLDESNAESPRLEEARQSALEEAQRAGRPIDAKKKEIDSCKAQLQNLQRDVGSQMSGFDSKMPKLINMIRDDADFREKPVGPMGLHIKLLKPIWSNILEKSIGNLLNGFVVTSKQDQQRLSGMMRRLGLENCPVVIGNNQTIDTNGHEPGEQYDTVLRVLDISNDLIKRQLIINQGIEQTILVENRADAMRIMYEGTKPYNVKQCFCLHDFKRGWGLRLGYMPGSTDPSSGPIQPTSRKPRIKTDVDSQIAYQQETERHLHRELENLQARQRELQRAVQKRIHAISQHKRAEQQFQLQLQRAEEEVEKLQDELDRDNVEDGKLEGLKEYLREVEQEMTLHGGSYGEAVLAKEKQGAICAGLKFNLDNVRIRIADYEAGIKKAENKSKRIQQARQIALQEKNLAFEAVNEAKIIKETAEQKRNRQMSRVESFTGDATKVCARVPVDPGQTAASIDAKLDKLTRSIRAYNQKIGGTDDEILRKFEAADKAHKGAVTHVEGLLALHTLLKKTYEERLAMWRRFQRYISAKSRTNFTYLLSERGFRGKLLVDHKAKLLDIQVEPDETLLSAEGRQTKTLSGGEKSFSSICLLLSVWEAMGAPLRCLDEFDVFMDNVNRDVSTKMIIGAARRSVGRQFILITPNAIGGNADEGKDVKLIKLSDPRQGLLADL